MNGETTTEELMDKLGCVESELDGLAGFVELLVRTQQVDKELIQSERRERLGRGIKTHDDLDPAYRYCLAGQCGGTVAMTATTLFFGIHGHLLELRAFAEKLLAEDQASRKGKKPLVATA